MVLDMHGKPIADARVFIKDLKTNIIRTLTTDDTGTYKIYALPPSIDYEVSAEYKGKSSEKRLVSSFMNKQDNTVSFRLDVDLGVGGAKDTGPQFNTFDLVRLHASFDLPQGIPSPIPAVLLLHGYGEDRSVWDALKTQLLAHGWAVMALDLRGHGASTIRDLQTIKAAEAWRTDSNQFPLDIDPALDWLKSQPKVNNRKSVVIGYDIGADLALIASGRFPEVRTVVAINPKLSESLAMAGSAQDFSPRSTLILTSDEAEGNRIKAIVKNPVKILAVPLTAGTQPHGSATRS